jgi:hypothetical protein
MENARVDFYAWVQDRLVDPEWNRKHYGYMMNDKDRYEVLAREYEKALRSWNDEDVTGQPGQYRSTKTYTPDLVSRISYQELRNITVEMNDLRQQLLVAQKANQEMEHQLQQARALAQTWQDSSEEWAQKYAELVAPPQTTPDTPRHLRIKIIKVTDALAV